LTLTRQRKKLGNLAGSAAAEHALLMNRPRCCGPQSSVLGCVSLKIALVGNLNVGRRVFGVSPDDMTVSELSERR
jgi:hypothetical protein